METFIVEVLIAALSSYLLGKWIMGYFRAAGIVGEDVHKEGRPVLPTSGGIPVFLGFYFAVMAYAFLRTYIFREQAEMVDTLAGVLAILFITVVGFLDDINAAEGKRIGLKQWQKPLLTLPAAIPLMALNLGTSQVAIPFIGSVELGMLYPLVLVPIGFVGASNMVNLLAGLNGLESGMAVTYLTSLSIYTYYHSSLAAKVLSFGALGAVAGFFLLNRYPARFLPGDSLTYFLGATLAAIAIIGNVEKFVLVLSVPFFVEFALKARGRFREPTVGYVRDGKIYRKGGIYSLPHIFMNGKHSEKGVVRRVWAVSALFSLLAWLA